MVIYNIYQFLKYPDKVFNQIKRDITLRETLSIKNISITILSYFLFFIVYSAIVNYKLFPNLKAVVKNIILYPTIGIVFYIVLLFVMAFFIYELCKLFNRYFIYKEVLQIIFLSAIPFLLLVFFYPVPKIGKFIVLLGLFYQFFIIYQSGKSFFSFRGSRRFTWFSSFVFCFIFGLFSLFLIIQTIGFTKNIISIFI